MIFSNWIFVKSESARASSTRLIMDNDQIYVLDKHALTSSIGIIKDMDNIVFMYRTL